MTRTRESTQRKIFNLQNILERGYTEVRMFSKQFQIPLTHSKKKLLEDKIETLSKLGMRYRYISSPPYSKVAMQQQFPDAGKPYINPYRQRKKTQKNPNHVPKCDISDEALGIVEQD